MRTWEMDIFEEMDAIIDEFFTEWDKLISYEEEPEEPEEDEEEEEEEDEEEEEEEEEIWWYSVEEMIPYDKYDDERGGYEFQIVDKCGRAKCPTIYWLQRFNALKCGSEISQTYHVQISFVLSVLK